MRLMAQEIMSWSSKKDKNKIRKRIVKRGLEIDKGNFSSGCISPPLEVEI